MKTRFLLLSLLLTATFTTAVAQNSKTKNVVLISLDGFRWQEIFGGADSSLLFQKKYRKQDSSSLVQRYWGQDASVRRQKLMPFFWGTIAKQGQLYGNRNLKNYVNVRNKYWFSYPGRSETLCGYYDPAINSNSYPANPNENVFEFVNKQKGYENKVVAFAGWAAVANILNRDRSKVPVFNPYEDVKSAKLTEAQKLANELQYFLPYTFGKSERYDLTTYAIAKAYIAANHPKMIYIDFIDTDEFGHSGQYDSYLDAAHYLDKMIASLWETLQADPFYKNNTTIMICPDHGRGVEKGWVSHGSETAYSNETWMAVMGPDTPAKGEMNNESQIYQDQFAQTLANLLGFKFTANHTVGEKIESVTSAK